MSASFTTSEALESVEVAKKESKDDLSLKESLQYARLVKTSPNAYLAEVQSRCASVSML